MIMNNENYNDEQNNEQMSADVLKKLELLNTNISKSAVTILENFAALMERVEKLEVRVQQLEEENRNLRDNKSTISLN